MLGKIKTIVQFAPKKRLMRIEVNGRIAKTYVVDNYGNSKRWEKIKIGDRLEDLQWTDEEAGIIDADSEISVLK